MKTDAPKKRTIRTIPRERAHVQHQDPRARIGNFEEVACGFRVEDALHESARCLLCPDPACVAACPVGNDIPGFIRRIGAEDFEGAYETITRTNFMPAICGRVCPQEQQCEGSCTVGETLEPVAIGRLERWLGDLAIAEGWTTIECAEPNGLRVAVVGSGPAGLACAAEMAKAGCGVTVFEALDVAGGVPKYAIPGFRLPPAVIDAEVAKVRAIGVEFRCNTVVGRDFTLDQVIGEMGYHAVFVGIGASAPTTPGVPGEDLQGVISANDLLAGCNRDHAAHSLRSHRVAVIGAGNTAMDALRACVRLGAEKVACVYRRSRAESPACAEELDHAEEEGIEFHWLTNPTAFVDDGQGRVGALRCTRMTLGEADDSGRRRPIPVDGSEFLLDASLVVLATGSKVDPSIARNCVIKLDKRGCIETDERLGASMAGVFAGGDAVTGAATVVAAMAAGRKAARSMKAYLGLRDGQARRTGTELFGIDRGEHNFARVRET